MVRDIFFDIEEHHLPLSFLKAVITVENDARHLMFFTDQQLFYMSTQKLWFVDGTFKIVGAPFMQLLSVNVHVYYNGNRTLVPVAFIMMTRRRKMTMLLYLLNFLS